MNRPKNDKSDWQNAIYAVYSNIAQPELYYTKKEGTKNEKNTDTYFGSCYIAFAKRV